MGSNSCNVQLILLILGFVVSLVPAIQFTRYAWRERKEKLDSNTLLLLGVMGWATFTLSCSLMAFGFYGWDPQQCAPSELAHPITIVFCPGIIAFFITILMMSSIKREGIYREAKEAMEKENSS
ncbi:hypothetical protein [Candidatus Leptofilum sp.]|uniref:hypothetical protein n=1 Tax=Candidatus Leptofilum sp. TaxID=3241576 RepID=UPI003B5A1956